jgi:hypothetical protein
VVVKIEEENGFSQTSACAEALEIFLQLIYPLAKASGN